MLRDVPHPNVMEVLHSFIVDHAIWLVYPPTDWITLNGLMTTENPVFDEGTIACIMRQVLSVLHFLHQRGVAWFDVRPEHILIDDCGKVAVVLHSLRSIVQQKTRDSLPYVAPEQLQQIEDHDVQMSRFKADVWALGVTAVALFISRAPYEQLSLSEITAKIQDGSPVDEISSEVSITPAFGSFLDAALEREMNARPTAAQLLSTPFIQNAPGMRGVCVLRAHSQMKITSCNSSTLPSSTTRISTNPWM